MASILKYLTAEENSEKDWKVEMVSDIQFIIVATMSGNDFPSVPPSKKTKAAIGCAEAKKPAKIDDAETLTAGATTAAKLMQHMTDMSLKRASGKPGKSVRT